jgi:hypothetical protein
LIFDLREEQTISKFEFPKNPLTPFRKGGNKIKKIEEKLQKGENHET